MYDYPGGQPPSGPRRPVAARVRIVTDSASDIIPSHARAIGVFVVPNRILLDGRVFRDGIDISAAQFYAYLARARSAPSTQPALPADFYNTYLAAFRDGAAAIVSIHVSSNFSQVVQHAVTARDLLAPAPIDIIDSLQVGIGMWPAVIEAAQLANLGAPIQYVHERVRALLARTQVFVLVESLEPLRRSGRITRFQGLVGALIDAHPILTLERGEARLVESVRTRRRAVQRMGELVQEWGRGAGGIESLLVCGNSIEAIAEMEALLVQHYTGAMRKTWLGPTIGANLGPAVAVALVAPE